MKPYENLITQWNSMNIAARTIRDTITLIGQLQDTPF